MQSVSDEGYQIATLVVVVMTVLVSIALLLIFINPRIALNPFKPPLEAPTPVAALAALPATWTPTPIEVATPTPTETPTLLATATLVVQPPTPVPPTLTRAPTIPPSPTVRPPTRPPAVVAPTPIPLPYSFRSILRSCTFGTPTQIKGRVISGGGAVDGVRVRLATSPDVATIVEDQLVRRDSDTSTIYAFIISPPESGAFDWHVWVVDGQDKLLSDPSFRVTINSLPASSSGACRIANVDFVR